MHGSNHVKMSAHELTGVSSHVRWSSRASTDIGQWIALHVVFCT